jgi:hypothetical protein
MKPGDKVKVSNYRDDTYQMMTVLEVMDKSVKLEHPSIGGYFIISKKLVYLA